MNKKTIQILSFFVLLSSATSVIEARTYLDAKRESLQRMEEKRLKPQDYYGFVMKAYEDHDYKTVIDNSILLLKEYPKSLFVQETLYTQAISFYNLQEYHLANEALSSYLNNYSNLKHFEDAIHHKFEIARKFQSGEKKRLFGGRHSPKLLSGKEDAIKIYDEVITTLPRNDLAAQSLFQKGKLLAEFASFKEAVDSYQMLIRRFPKNPLAPESYVAIAETYLLQCKEEFPDPNFIELAEINLRKFEQDFPGETRISTIRAMLQKMKERFAQELFDMGKFFEKKKKERAAFLYYVSILQKYPTTGYATIAQERIDHLRKHSKHPEELTI
ncbi:MAG: outer membrane protein assembly factor BamD [Simkaniaceae bacterium]|nr:outer membrane protein assembly factor BamD [Simkaniaceae bacterium]